MKIALCAAERGPGCGPDPLVPALAAELAARGQRVHLFTPGFTKAEHPPGFDVHPVNGAGGPADCAAAVAAAGPFDVVHAFQGAWRPGVEPVPHIYHLLGGTLAQEMEQRVRAEPSGLRRRLKRLRNLFAFGLLRRLGAERDLYTHLPPTGPTIATPSHYVAAQLRQLYGVADGRIRVIYAAALDASDAGGGPAGDWGELRPAARRRMSVGERETVILTMIRDPVLDGLREAIAVAAAVKADLAGAPGKKTFRLLVTGPPGIERYARSARRAGVGELVQFRPGKTEDAECLAAADGVLLPDYDDPAGGRLLTALARQLPCVTTRFNGAVELIEDGRSGYVVDSPEDVASTADRVVMLTESIKRYKFRSNLKELVESLGVRRFADDVLLLYTGLKRGRE